MCIYIIYVHYIYLLLHLLLLLYFCCSNSVKKPVVHVSLKFFFVHRFACVETSKSL